MLYSSKDFSKTLFYGFFLSKASLRVVHLLRCSPPLSSLSRRHLSGRERGEEREREKEREALMQFLPKTFLHHGGRKRRKGGENNTEPLLWRKNASKNAFRFPSCTRKKSKLQLFRRRVICKFSLRQMRLCCADNGENVTLCSCVKSSVGRLM